MMLKSSLNSAEMVLNWCWNGAGMVKGSTSGAGWREVVPEHDNLSDAS